MPRRRPLLAPIALPLICAAPTHAQREPHPQPPQRAAEVTAHPQPPAYPNLPITDAPAAERDEAIANALVNLNKPNDKHLKPIHDLFAKAQHSTARIAPADRQAIQSLIDAIRPLGPRSRADPQQLQLRRDLLEATQAALALQPEITELWTIRQSIALDLNLPREGWQATQALKTLQLGVNAQLAILVRLGLERSRWYHEDSAWIDQLEGTTPIDPQLLERWAGTWVGTPSLGVFRDHPRLSLRVKGNTLILARLKLPLSSMDTGLRGEITLPGKWIISPECSVPLTQADADLEWLDPGRILRITIHAVDIPCSDSAGRIKPKTHAFSLVMNEGGALTLANNARYLGPDSELSYFREIGHPMKRVDVAPPQPPR